MPDNQVAKIERSGLAGRLDAWCVSGEVGIRKPDARVFQVAAERCGTTLAAGGWMVGDSPEHDVAGGRAAGLRTIWIGTAAGWPRDQVPADRTVPDVLAAIGFLRDEVWPARPASRCPAPEHPVPEPPLSDRAPG
jgi:FMN phosphatase YigB (HAD superfamily)